MALDSFFRKPFRTAKGGGTKCTTCEIVEPCDASGKCILPLICATISEYNLTDCSDPIFLYAGGLTDTFRYDCDRHGFDLSVECDYETIDFFITYELIYDEPNAVLRSYALGIEVAVPFTDAINASCPNFDFGVLTTRPYPMVSLGPQMCIDSGPDDCTAGRCLPRFLCASITTPETMANPYRTVLEWYTDDSVVIDDICCCNANTFPEMLIARVVNYSSGCTAIAPQRVATIYYPAEHAGANVDDAGALIHLFHHVADQYDSFVTDYPFVPSGAHVWESRQPDNLNDLVQLSPAPGQTVTSDTRTIMGRMILWCDPTDGEFKGAFETVDRTTSYADDWGSYDPYNPYSTVTVFDSVSILACNPFSVRCTGIVENLNCQTINNVDGTGNLEIVVSEFTGWVGDDPVNIGGKMTLYSERVATAAFSQTSASDCILKLHIGGDTSFKGRADFYTIENVWPDPVWLYSTTFRTDIMLRYESISTVTVTPQSCNGCVPQFVQDPYGPITTPCCSVTVPRTLYITSVADNTCPCADGTVITLSYDDVLESWVGGGPFGQYGGSCPGCEVRFVLTCTGLVGTSVWRLEFYVNDVIYKYYEPSHGQSFNCSPFVWITEVVSSVTCCKPTGAFPATFHWIITA